MKTCICLVRRVKYFSGFTLSVSGKAGTDYKNVM